MTVVAPAINFEPVEVMTDGGHRTGQMCFADGVLVAVLTPIPDAETGTDEPGGWYLEAGFGACGPLTVTTPPLFASLGQATAWVRACLAAH